MTLQGYQIVVCEGGSANNLTSAIMDADHVYKYWRATRKQAQELKDELHMEYSGVIFIRS